MKMRLVFILLVSAFASLLVGCYNRIQEYQPYSTFDDRMAEANLPQKQGSKTQDPYAENQTNNYPTTNNNYSSYDNQFQEPQNTSNQPKNFARAASGMSQGSSDTEVPFTNSRSPKQATNIGAL